MARSARVRWTVLVLFALVATVGWSSSKSAVTGAAGNCVCEIAGEVWSSGLQIGGDDDYYESPANDVLDCAANVCQNRTLQLGAVLCNNYGGDTYITHWNWRFHHISGTTTGHLDQQYGCGDIGR